jgi:hypothetical protein
MGQGLDWRESAHKFWLTCGEPVRSLSIHRRRLTIGVRFVTAEVADLKLCSYVPLGDRNLQTKFQSDL